MKRPTKGILAALIALLLPLMLSLLPISRARVAEIEKDPLQNKGSSAASTVVASASEDPSVIASTIFQQNFDGVVAPALPAGWTTNTSGIGVAWTTSTSGPDTAPNDAFGPESANIGTTNLNSPVIAVPAGGTTQLQFRNRYNLERGGGLAFDGMVLEISINAGAFADILASGGSFVTGGYNDTISPDFNSPLPGRMAWSGLSSGTTAAPTYITTIVSLPVAANGQNIQLRWRVGSDQNNVAAGLAGARIDTITLSTPPILACTLNEGFDAITTLPGSGWVQLNRSSPVGLNGWVQGDSFQSQSGANFSYIAANFNNTTGANTISNWLLTPTLTLANGDQLKFYTRTFTTVEFPDRLQVRMSLNGASTDVGATATSVGDFTTLLLDINPTYTTTAYPTDWTQFTVTLSGIAVPTTGRLAFRYFVENGGPDGVNSDYIGIDTVQFCGPAVNIGGNVSYCSSAGAPPVPNVTLNLTGGATASTMSDSLGSYQVSSLPGGNYTVTPTKSALPTGSSGINTVDVISAQRQFLGIGTPLSGCRLDAANANGDGAINTIDVIAIQRFFLGLMTGTANVGQWRFNPASRSYNSLLADQNGQNYDALVIGDINGDLTPASPNDAKPSESLAPSAVATVSLPIASVATSVTNFTLPVTTSTISAADNLVGFQGDFTFDSSVVTFQGTPASAAGLTSSNWNVTANILGAGTIKTLRISAFSNDFTPLSGSGTLFNLNFTRVSSVIGASTALTWAAPPNDFLFINASLSTQAPGSTPSGNISIGGVPTAAPATISGRISTSEGAPLAGTVMYLNGAATRTTISDGAGNYHFDNLDTGNFYTITPSLANYHFAPASLSFSLVGNTTDAAFTATPDAFASANAIDTAEYFVRQHYLDFLNREPDDAGFNFWSAVILSCGNDPACVEVKRINTSAAYFLSIEFQQTGYEVYRMYKAAYGNLPDAPVPIRFDEFLPDTREIGEGVIVNQTGWEQKLEDNTQAFANEFVSRSRFTSLYGSMSDAQFVDALNQNAGGVLSQSERDELVTMLTSGAKTRAQVLRSIAENEQLGQQEFSRAFVLMEYFGYLRRDPNAPPDTDFTGYNFWLTKLNNFGGNFEQAEMVKAFIRSSEYRGRFGP